MLDLVRIAIISACIAAGTAAHFYFNDPKDDAVIKAVVVRVIEHETGIHVDIPKEFSNK